MVAVVWVRSGSAFLWRIEAAAIAPCLLAIPVIHYVQGGGIEDTLVILSSLGLLYMYFLMAVISVWRSRLAVERARVAEVERAKMEAVGNMTGGVAHDFNNLLTTVLGNLDLAKTSQTEAERQQLLDEAIEAGQYGATLIGHLMDFTQRARLSPERTQVKDICGRMNLLVSRTLGDNHRVSVDIQADLPDIYIDNGKIQTVLLNLVLNARDAMAEGGVIRFSAMRTRALGQDTVTLKIGDDGIGIPKDKLATVFEPFVTLKPFGENTGLGLSMAKGVAEQSGGRIEIASEVGRGTEVSLHLPVAADANHA